MPLVERSLCFMGRSTPWGAISSSFEFKREDAAYTLLRIFKKLDGFIGDEKESFDQQKGRKTNIYH